MGAPSISTLTREEPHDLVWGKPATAFSYPQNTGEGGSDLLLEAGDQFAVGGHSFQPLLKVPSLK